ncbi:hypothetical protein [Saccharibacillus qingshengii]|uniref:hypothetical protein n=1 Tax=Saccharibacillus qingshengii TaxID=1763540 RepID=UPI0015575CDF|nr:hypothetical protein [Saccharibacillus qingshengii]
MKINRDKIKGFALGVLATAVFAIAGGTAIAASKGELMNIRVVQGGIKLFVDGKLSIPKDSKGKTVEPFIYDGTTYLPLRAVSDILTNSTKPVKWDSASSSIYLGQAPMAAQTDLAELEVYSNNSSTSSIATGENAQFQLLDKQINAFNKVWTNQRIVYILDSKYSSLNASMVVPYTTLGSSSNGYIEFGSLNKQGIYTKISSYDTKAGIDPVALTVDLRGVEILQISTTGYDYAAEETKGGSDAILYNVTLSGIK